MLNVDVKWKDLPIMDNVDKNEEENFVVNEETSYKPLVS